eukprot:1157762-Pelagomonas_calceolata.AAC.3
MILQAFPAEKGLELSLRQATLVLVSGVIPPFPGHLISARSIPNMPYPRCACSQIPVQNCSLPAPPTACCGSGQRWGAGN